MALCDVPAVLTFKVVVLVLKKEEGLNFSVRLEVR